MIAVLIIVGLLCFCRALYFLNKPDLNEATEGFAYWLMWTLSVWLVAGGYYVL